MERDAVRVLERVQVAYRRLPSRRLRIAGRAVEQTIVVEAVGLGNWVGWVVEEEIHRMNETETAA